MIIKSSHFDHCLRIQVKKKQDGNKRELDLQLVHFFLFGLSQQAREKKDKKKPQFTHKIQQNKKISPFEADVPYYLLAGNKCRLC